MGRLGDALIKVFPTFDRSRIVDSLRIGDIPGWDSMTAMNLLMVMEVTFKIKLRRVLFHDGLTVSDLADMVRGQWANVD
jgi:acyl carrier protein